VTDKTLYPCSLGKYSVTEYSNYNKNTIDENLFFSNYPRITKSNNQLYQQYLIKNANPTCVCTLEPGLYEYNQSFYFVLNDGGLCKQCLYSLDFNSIEKIELSTTCEGSVNGNTFKKISNLSFSLNSDNYVYLDSETIPATNFTNPLSFEYDDSNCNPIVIKNLSFSNLLYSKQRLEFELSNLNSNKFKKVIFENFWIISNEYFAISNDYRFICKFDVNLQEIIELVSCDCDDKLIDCPCKIVPNIYKNDTNNEFITILNGNYKDCSQCIVFDSDPNAQTLKLSLDNNCATIIDNKNFQRLSVDSFEVDNVIYNSNYVNITTSSIGPNTEVKGLSLCDGNCQPCIYFIKDVQWDNNSQTVTFKESLDGGFNYNTITISKIVDNSGETFGINDNGTVLYFIDLSVPLVSEIITCECDWSIDGCGADPCVLRPGLYNQGPGDNQFAAILNSGDCTNQCIVEFPGGGSDTTQLDNLSPLCSQDIKWRSSDQTFTRTGIQNFTITGESDAYVIVETLYTTFSLTNKGPFTLNATSPCTNDPITAKITNIDNSKPQIDLELIQGGSNPQYISLTLIFETGNPFGEFVAINNDGTMMFVFDEVGSGNDLLNIITCECLYQ